MGDYFKKEKKTEEEQEAPALIDDYDRLLSTYTDLLRRIEDTMRGSSDRIIPLYQELKGSDDTADDLGQIDELRRKIRNTGVKRMTIGPLMIDAVRNMDDYMSWTEDFQRRIEAHVNGLKVIAQSSFKFIHGLQEKIQGLQEQMRTMAPVPTEQVYYPLTVEQATDFRRMMIPKIDEYKRSIMTGAHIQKVASTKGIIFRQIGGHPDKKRIVDDMFGQAERDIQLWKSTMAEMAPERENLVSAREESSVSQTETEPVTTKEPSPNDDLVKSEDEKTVEDGTTNGLDTQEDTSSQVRDEQ